MVLDGGGPEAGGGDYPGGPAGRKYSTPHEQLADVHLQAEPSIIGCWAPDYTSGPCDKQL